MCPVAHQKKLKKPLQEGLAMSVLLARGTAALIRTRVAVRRFGGHGHGDGKYTFDREFRRCFSLSPVVRWRPAAPLQFPRRVRLAVGAPLLRAGRSAPVRA